MCLLSVPYVFSVFDKVANFIKKKINEILACAYLFKI